MQRAAEQVAEACTTDSWESIHQQVRALELLCASAAEASRGKSGGLNGKEGSSHRDHVSQPPSPVLYPFEAQAGCQFAR